MKGRRLVGPARLQLTLRCQLRGERSVRASLVRREHQRAFETRARRGAVQDEDSFRGERELGEREK